MAFDFPNSPTPGSVYSPAGGPSYTWDGQKWVMTGSAIAYTPAYDQRSRIVNGAMQISQENGNTAGNTAGYYMADQWRSDFSTSAAVFDLRRMQIVTPKGSINRIRASIITPDTSLAAGEYWQFVQYIEGIRIADFAWGTASARQIILRFGFQGPAGTYSIALCNTGGARSYVAQFTISAAQAGVDTEQVFVIPGDTSGTWAVDTAYGMIVRIVLACGSSLQGTTGWQAGNMFGLSTNSNGMGATNNFFLFDVGLYLDPTGSGVAPAWEMPDEAQELAACQRYWAQTSILWSGQAVSTMLTYARTVLPVTMRATPTLTGVIQGGVSGFPNTVGTLGAITNMIVQETRTGNATAQSGVWGSLITANARM